MALERGGGGVDGDFRHDLGDVAGAGVAAEPRRCADVVLHFFDEDGDVGAQGLGGESLFYELFS